VVDQQIHLNLLLRLQEQLPPYQFLLKLILLAQVLIGSYHTLFNSFNSKALS